ncbi:ABC transporter substrate-binding protein [Sinosporangium siamense]|nr:ABC transporter substrate-binding protein [Sinosporangium siamense]
MELLPPSVRSRGRPRHSFTAAIILLAAGLALTGCAGGTALGRDAGTVVIGSEGEIPPLDPHRLNGTVGLRLIDALYDPLVREDLSKTSDRAPALVPGLAQSWTTSADARTHTFTLRPGVLFADGTAFDADAVKVNFARIMDKSSPVYDKTAAGNMSFLTRWIDTVSTPDASTVVLKLKEPYAAMPRLLTDRRMSIISPAALKQIGGDEIGLKPVGTGSFSVQSFEQGKRLDLRPNPKFWGGKPRAAKIIIEAVTDPTTLAIAAQTGEVDAILSAGAQQVKQFQHNDIMAVQYPDPANQYFIRLNTRIAPTSRPEFRQALNYAIDRAAIARLTGGQAAPSTHPIPKGNEAYDASTRQGAGYSHDPGKARRLLAESGVATPVRLRVLSPNSGPGFTQATEIMSLIQQDLKAIGVELDVQYMEFASLLAQEGPGYPDGVHGSFNGWTTGAASADFLERMFSGKLVPPGGVNRGWYRNGRVDALFDQARGERDDAERFSLYRRAGDLIAGDAPWVFLYQDRLPRLLNREVTGVVPATSVYIDYTTLGRR